MKFNKGDLIATTTPGDKRETAIVVGTYSNGHFAYCYSIDSGQYRLVYLKELEFIIKEDFDPEFPSDNFFDLDSFFYSTLVDSYTYTPFFGYPIEEADDEDD
jgi:hypothetical protein